MDPTIARIAAYARSLEFEHLDDVAIHEAKRRLIDTLGCALGGYDAEPCRIARKIAQRASCSPGSRLLGSQHRTLPELAAFANGVMARYQDPFPSGADVAVMASNQSLYGAEFIRNVVQKTFDALAPGGEMHFIGHLLNADRTGPAEPAQWALGQAITRGTGHAHAVSDVRGYFEAAGFVDVWDGDFLPNMLEWVRGTKPA